MNSYYTGTTIENLELILKDGKLKIKPPHRVWEEESKDYVYLIPADEEKEDGEPFELCLEQSSFALSVLNGTKRVVLEIQGIDEALLEEDPDGPYNSVAYPSDIPVEFIANIFIEKESVSDKVKELIAVTHFVQRQKLKSIDLELKYIESEYNKEAVYEEINIPNIRLVPVQYLIDEQELSNHYMDLIEEVDRGIPMVNYTMNTINDYFETLQPITNERVDCQMNSKDKNQHKYSIEGDTTKLHCKKCDDLTDFKRLISTEVCEEWQCQKCNCTRLFGK